MECEAVMVNTIKYENSPRRKDFADADSYKKAYARWYTKKRKLLQKPRVDEALPKMKTKAKLGAAASHMNQNYDRTESIKKEAEIESRVIYLDDIPDDFCGIASVVDLPPMSEMVPGVKNSVWQ